MSRLRKIERHISTPHHPIQHGAAESDREERYNTHTTNVDSNNPNRDKRTGEHDGGEEGKGGSGSDDITR